MQVAPPPGPPPLPSRKIAIACNIGLVALLVTSYAGCARYGCSSRHLSESAWVPLAIVGGMLSAMASAVAVYIFFRNLQSKGGATTILGLVTTILLGLLTTCLTPLFWVVAGTGASTIGFGGWGRPLRVGWGRRQVTPGVRASKEWANGPRPSVDTLDQETRDLLRDLWLQDARKEHASVPAFGQVAWQLVALGAPADLVRRAHVSCLQEIDHAERCFALASTYGGEDLGVQAMPALFASSGDLPRDMTKALEKVATEALVDGALLEDYNAELAATALPDASDPAAREALVRVVDDERDHARLAWDIIAFCVERGGDTVARALAKRFAQIPDEPVSLYADDLSARVAAMGDAPALAAHGRVRAAVAGEVFRARKAFAATKLASILDTRGATTSALAA